MATKKKQFTFYADDDVAKFLNQLDPGSKTRQINAALRTIMQSGQKQFFEQSVNADKLSKLEKEIEDLRNTLHEPASLVGIDGQQPKARGLLINIETQTIPDGSELDPNVLETIRHEIELALKQRKLAEKKDILNYAAAGYSYALLLLIYIQITGSQIKLLEFLYGGPLTVQRIKHLYYDPAAKSYPDIYSQWQFDLWLNYLVSTRLIEKKNDVCSATALCRQFIRFALDRQLSLSKIL